MVRSQLLNSLNKEEKEKLIERLLEQQNHRCFICEEPLDPNIHEIDIDHVIPLSQGGKDNENNLAITHRSCNRSKQDNNPRIRNWFLFSSSTKTTTFSGNFNLYNLLSGNSPPFLYAYFLDFFKI